MQACIEYIRRFKSVKLACVIGFCVLALDIITKFAVVSTLLLGESVPVCSFFNLARVHNYGLTFGTLYGFRPGYMLAGLSLVIGALLIYWSNK